MNSNLQGVEPLTLDYRAIYPSNHLDGAIADLNGWEDLQERHGVGACYLAMVGCCWLVYASANLAEKILPF
jgi:hypothetical protein